MMIFKNTLLLLTALCSCLDVIVASSFSLGPNNEESVHIVPSTKAHDDIRRELRPNPGFNCLVTASIDCFVVSDRRTDCKELKIRRDLCGKIDVMMSYTYCNEEEDPIILREGLTQASIYDDFSLALNKKAMEPKECRTMYRQKAIDTCQRNWIVASLKVEGWKRFYENADNYCFAYTHYYPPINKYDPPTQPPLPNIPVIPPVLATTALCYLETFVGSGEFTKQCEDLDLDYIELSRLSTPNRRRVLSTRGADDYKRNIKVVFKIENQSQEDLDVLTAGMIFNNDYYNIIGPNDGVVVTMTESLLLERQFVIDFAVYSGQDLDVITKVTTRGQKSLLETSATDKVTISIP